MALLMQHELFDVVDELDNVLRQEYRSIVHADGLLHRSVNMFVFNCDGELLLQKRSAIKDEFPLLWTSSASGHVDAGETYEQAAHRELQEELGMEVDLKVLAKFPASQETANEHTVLFEAVTDAEPVPDPAEIAEVKFVTINQLNRIIEEQPADFTPPFLLLYSWYLSSLNRNRSKIN